MIKSLQEDYEAGLISDDKYKELYNRYQKVLRNVNKVNSNKNVSKSEPSNVKPEVSAQSVKLDDVNKFEDENASEKPIKESFEEDKSLYRANDSKSVNNFNIDDLAKDFEDEESEIEQDTISKYQNQIIAVLSIILVILIILTIYIFIEM
ncbi:hypothetical protein BGI41_01555 [Methanobrevibacter sp. 87.7]|uniref:hypothetical protein n=1 Tax=Methanobrevibacter sp. 87.7 TaxID=387957 RepID=UPI000B503653|nr:hypothetical protein [Methanobrevibacter sp. 87.7]OWT33597.1 hypothetical protein BGI41_01555 [Methanobrevibacter sp. 87.7]